MLDFQFINLNSENSGRKLNNMKLAFVRGVSVIAVLVIASAKAVPVSIVNSDHTFENLNKNYEVVDGPQEILLPVSPFRSIWKREDFPKEGASDLDYMVYGKVYLMKALGIAARSSFASSSTTKENLNLIKNEDLDNTVALTRSSVTSSPISNEEHNDIKINEAIQFPSNMRSTRRPYQFKYWNTPKPSTLISNFNNGPHRVMNHQRLDIRKLKERSAEMYDEPEVTTQPTAPDHTSASTSNPSVIIQKIHNDPNSKARSSEEDSESLDDDALELLNKSIPLSQLFQSNPMLSKPQSTSPNTKRGHGHIDVDDRFLIHVPNKSNHTKCPEGQRRTHFGTCKPVVTHHPSPQDGFYRGRITASGNHHKIAASSDLQASGNSRLAAFLMSLRQLETKLERVIKTSEKELTDLVSKAEEGQQSQGGSNDKIEKTKDKEER